MRDNVAISDIAAETPPHVRESKTLLDSGFHAVGSGFHLLDSRSFSVELGFRIRIVSEIPDSYTCIPDSKAQDSGFHKQRFPRFRIPNAKISRIPESGFLYMGRLRARFSAAGRGKREARSTAWAALCQILV